MMPASAEGRIRPKPCGGFASMTLRQVSRLAGALRAPTLFRRLNQKKGTASSWDAVPLRARFLLLSFLFTRHFEIDLRVLFSLHRNLLAGFAQLLVPNLDVVGSRRHVRQLEAS